MRQQTRLSKEPAEKVVQDATRKHYSAEEMIRIVLEGVEVAPWRIFTAIVLADALKAIALALSDHAVDASTGIARFSSLWADDAGAPTRR